MPESLPPLDARTRKTLAVILQRVADVGGDSIGRALGIDPSNVSRMKGDLERFARLLTVLDIKPVPIAWRCVDPDEYQQLKRWAIKRLEMQDDDNDTGLHWESAS